MTCSCEQENELASFFSKDLLLGLKSKATIRYLHNMLHYKRNFNLPFVMLVNLCKVACQPPLTEIEVITLFRITAKPLSAFVRIYCSQYLAKVTFFTTVVPTTNLSFNQAEQEPKYDRDFSPVPVL